MKLEVKVPAVGESVTTAEIESWEKQSGDFVKKGDILVILETDKASMEVPAEQDGLLTLRKNKGETVSVDEVIAFIDTNAQQPQEKSPSDKAPSDQKLKNQGLSTKEDSKELKRQSFSKISEWKEALSPSVRRLVETKELNPSQIKGTGKRGPSYKDRYLKSFK